MPNLRRMKRSFHSFHQAILLSLQIPSDGFSHSFFPYPAVFVCVGFYLCSVYVNVVEVNIFHRKNVTVDIRKDLIYFLFRTLFIKLPIVEWLGGGLSCSSHIKRISVLQSFSIFRNDSYPFSINANSITFSKVSSSYLGRPVLRSSVVRYLLRSI